MNIDAPGKITDRITLLGKKESNLYLVEGRDQSALLGGGMAYIAPDVSRQLRDLGVAEEKISHIIIHHAHFDHVGAVPFLRRRWPGATVHASARARELLASPKIVDSVIAFNQALLEQNAPDFPAAEANLNRAGFTVDQVLSEGDVISLGDLDLEILEVPGHSSCSIAVYIPREKALAASDAGGIPYGGDIFASANSNFDQYQASLQKMARLDVDIFLAEHYGASVGEEGRTYIPRSIEAARRTREALEKIYSRVGDEQKATEEVTDYFMSNAAGYFLPREVMAMVAGQMIRFIARTASSRPR
ncbi:MAG: MBL fold metallo-hydrolase [Pseudomonadota bacterium]